MTIELAQAPVSAPATGNTELTDARTPLGRQRQTARALSDARLAQENRRFHGTGGRSEENRGLGFAPAFRDADTGLVYRSCFRDGSPAPFHLLDGLPAGLVAAREASGRVASLKPSVVSGFLREGRFFTRDEAASWLAELCVGAA